MNCGLNKGLFNTAGTLLLRIHCLNEINASSVNVHYFFLMYADVLEADHSQMTGYSG